MVRKVRDCFGVGRVAVSLVVAGIDLKVLFVKIYLKTLTEERSNSVLIPRSIIVYVLQVQIFFCFITQKEINLYVCVLSDRYDKLT